MPDSRTVEGSGVSWTLGCKSRKKGSCNPDTMVSCGMNGGVAYSLKRNNLRTFYLHFITSPSLISRPSSAECSRERLCGVTAMEESVTC
jgi:hypothetical protein